MLRDRDVVLEAVLQCGDSLQFAATELLRDREFVLEAVRQDGLALEHAAPELLRDRDVVLEAVRHDGLAREHAALEPLQDRDVVLEAVRHSDGALEHAAPELRDDPVLQPACARENPLAGRGAQAPVLTLIDLRRVPNEPFVEVDFTRGLGGDAASLVVDPKMPVGDLVTLARGRGLAFLQLPWVTRCSLRPCSRRSTVSSEDSQRQTSKDAGKIAGVEVSRIINEPTAVALAFGMEAKDGQTIAVYDLGGGTFDPSILEISGGVFEVKATNGDTSLGGEDIDFTICEYFIGEFKKTRGIVLSKDKLAVQRLREAAETAKGELSSKVQTDVSPPFITADQTGPKHVNIPMTRSKLEQLVGPLIDRTKKPCLDCTKDSGMSNRTSIQCSSWEVPFACRW